MLSWPPSSATLGADGAIASVVVAIGSLGVLWWQTSSFLEKDRAWFSVSIDSVPLYRIEGMTDADRNPIKLRVVLTNSGRSAATVKDIAVSFAIINRGDTLPTKPRYVRSQRQHFGNVYQPGEDLTNTISISPLDAARVYSGEKNIFVYGRVKYRDAFRKLKTHQFRFCVRFVADENVVGTILPFPMWNPDGPKAYRRDT